MSNIIENKKKQMLGLDILTNEILKDNILNGLNVAVYLHGTSESSIFMYYLRKLGMNVYYSSCNPLSLQKDVVNYLSDIGINCYSKYGENSTDIHHNIKKILENKIDFIVDDGCALVSQIVANNIDNIPLGASEQTTWGINKCNNLLKNVGSLKFPIIGVNNHKTKHIFDNNKGVSSSLLAAITSQIDITFAGKKVLIIGYGSVGKGIARDLKNLGAIISVSEVSNYAALEAYYDGISIGEKKDLIKDSDFIITATGSKHVMVPDDLRIAKDGVFLLNAGHSDVEIDVESIYNICNNIQPYTKHIEEIKIFNKNIYLFTKGRVANLIAGNGNPPEIMDLTFMNQLYAIYYGIKYNNKLDKNKINNLSNIFDEKISKIKLSSYKIQIDEKSSIQEEYLSKWITQI